MSYHEMKGFDDACGFLLDPRPDEDDVKWNDYHRPPTGVPDCAGCASSRVQDNDCPACQYELGFTEVMSK